jgi:replicative DNA helicase Mcm
MSIEERILEVVKKKGEASLADFYAAIQEFPKPSVRSKVSILVKKGLLQKTGKGVYTLPKETTPATDTSYAAGITPSAEGAPEENDDTSDTGSGASTAREDTGKDNVSPETISRGDLRERVLRLLRRQPDATPGEVADALGVSRDAVVQIFTELIDRGLLEPPKGVDDHTVPETESQRRVSIELSEGELYACRSLLSSVNLRAHANGYRVRLEEWEKAWARELSHLPEESQERIAKALQLHEAGTWMRLSAESVDAVLAGKHRWIRVQEGITEAAGKKEAKEPEPEPQEEVATKDSGLKEPDSRGEHRAGTERNPKDLRNHILREVEKHRGVTVGELLEVLSGENEEEVCRQVLLMLEDGTLRLRLDGTLTCGDIAEKAEEKPETLEDILRMRLLKVTQIANITGHDSLWELLLASEKYRKRLAEIGRYFPKKKRLIIDFDDVAALSYELADSLLENPDRELQELRAVAGRLAARHHISAELLVPDEDREDVRIAPLPINVGVSGVPEVIEARQIGEPRYFAKLVSLEGIVSRAGFPFSRLVVGAFECQRCGELNHIPQPEDLRGVKEPYLCEHCEKKGPFRLNQEESSYERVQVIHIIDDISEVSEAMPGVAEVVLRDDLPRIIPPGSRVKVCGIVRGTTSKKSRERRPFLEALYIERLDSDPSEEEMEPEDLKKIRELARDPQVVDRLIASIAPHIYGLRPVKEAILYQLFSSPRIKSRGRRIRGEIHILVVGEPSVGKSDTARWVHQNRLLPRSVYVDCENATGAGLTVAAVKDETTGAWSIEAGAVVLADRGLLVLDEFDKLSTEHRKALHTPMEAGVVDVAKAGVKGTFPARCSVLACANPKYGRFDEYRPLSEQINLPPTILSRFDLIFLVRDDLAITREVARHVLGEEGQEQQDGDVIPPELLRKYIAYARKNVKPTLSEEAKKIIEEFYVEARERAMSAEDMPIPLTVRQLRAAMRLAKARARARLSNTATAEDAMAAVALIKESLSQVGLDLETGRFDIDKIYVGVTKSQRDRIATILNIIRELEESYGTAKKSEILELAEKQGISRDWTLECIEELKRQGDIFEPKYDHFKTT